MSIQQLLQTTHPTSLSSHGLEPHYLKSTVYHRVRLCQLLLLRDYLLFLSCITDVNNSVPHFDLFDYNGKTKILMSKCFVCQFRKYE